MGPFLDFNNKIISSGVLKEGKAIITYNKFFKMLIQKFTLSLNYKPKIIIQPSCKDIHHPYAIPQRSF